MDCAVAGFGRGEVEEVERAVLKIAEASKQIDRSKEKPGRGRRAASRRDVRRRGFWLIKEKGTPPRQTASDGGYASLDNLKQVKAMGVQDVAFHKKRAPTIDTMVKSHWVYCKLRNFRAGIEANISCLKRAFGLARCTWRGLAHFKAYVWSSVVAYNLALFARLAAP